ncbi:MAG: class I SAM-dependent methyltransferase [Betaproteobacteria bacterium]
MNEPVREFYDGLADQYHFLFADWREEVAKQGEALAAIIRREAGPAAASVLDCAYGIGTQAIGLALRGYRVHASDFSEAAVARARGEAASFGVELSFGVADFRALDAAIAAKFDIAICCDNALSHCLDDPDLSAAATQVRARLNAGGLFVASIRDYDLLLEQSGAEPGRDPGLPGLHGQRAAHGPPRGTMPQVFDDADGRRIAFQVWDWAPDRRSYAVHQYFLQEFRGQYDTTHHLSRFRALLRRELEQALRAAGFADVRWHMPPGSGYYQPVVTARA